MKNKFILILGFLVIITLITPLHPNQSNSTVKKELKTSALTEISVVITINDLPGSSTNWTWAKDQGFCTGNGTIHNPYIISDFFFNNSIFANNCLNILHSRKPFIIEDSLFKGHSNFAGVKLTNTTNGVIRNNQLYQIIGALVWIFNSSLNEINNNNASDAFAYGILIDGISGLCHSNIIVENLISSNFESGILLRGYSVSNQILSNTIDSNSEGIDIWPFASNNIIQSNMIRDNTNFGISIESDNNTIYQNCFVDNALDALDDGIGNNWDYGMSGNYWDNYTGSDDNKDGIGDVPYDIGGIAVSRDNYPLMSCPFIITPGGIPGYNLILLVIIGTGMIICTICLMLRKNGYWNNGTINSV